MSDRQPKGPAVGDDKTVLRPPAGPRPAPGNVGTPPAGKPGAAKKLSPSERASAAVTPPKQQAPRTTPGPQQAKPATPPTTPARQGPGAGQARTGSAGSAPAKPSGPVPAGADRPAGAPGAAQRPLAAGQQNAPGKQSAAGKPEGPGKVHTPGRPGVPGQQAAGSRPSVSAPVAVSAGAAPKPPDFAGPVPAKGDDAPTMVKPAPAAQKSPDSADSAAKAKKPATRRTRKARLRLAQIDPWSAMKTTFLFSFAFLIATLAAVAMLYLVVDAAGLFNSVNAIVSEVLSPLNDPNQFKVESILSFQRVMGFTGIVGALNVVLMTTIGTLGAFLYNLSATILGGIEVTLAED